MDADNKFLDIQENNRHIVGWKGKPDDGPRYMAVFQTDLDAKDMALCCSSQITLFLRDKIGRFAITYNESSVMLVEADGTIDYAGRTVVARDVVARRQGTKAIVKVPLDAPQNWTISSEVTVTNPPLQLDSTRFRQISDLANRLLRDFIGTQQPQNGGRPKGAPNKASVDKYRKIVNQRKKYKTDNEYLVAFPAVTPSTLDRAIKWATEADGEDHWTRWHNK